MPYFSKFRKNSTSVIFIILTSITTKAGCFVLSTKKKSVIVLEQNKTNLELIRREKTSQFSSAVTTLCWHCYMVAFMRMWILEISSQAAPIFSANSPSSYNHCYFNNCIHFKETQVMQLPAKALKLTKSSGHQHF